MKLILLSDSHGYCKGALDKLFKTLQFDYLFFMGDGLKDFELYSNLENVITVSGNCDFFSTESNEKQIELCGQKILVTHGNKYGVKSGLGKILERAKQLGVNFVFYGHTHQKRVDKIDDIYFINPGKFYPNADKVYGGLILTFSDDGSWSVDDLKITL